MSPISVNQIKFIKSLQQKKFRDREKLFVVEGLKNVVELLKSRFDVRHVYVTGAVSKPALKDAEQVSEKEMKRMSGYKTAPGVLAVVAFMNHEIDLTHGVHLYLDDVRDPGNLGTIVRSADWFGISSVICSPKCADVHNPKVIQSAMGSFFRMPIATWTQSELSSAAAEAKVTVLVADMEGDDINDVEWPEHLILVVGNESHGIGNWTIKENWKKVTIPKVGLAESLNVGVATSIILSMIRKSSS